MVDRAADRGVGGDHDVLAFYAFSVLPLAQTYAIIFAAPLLITILAIPILGEIVGWRRSVAVTVGLIGVMVVLRPGSTALSAGHLAALAAAVFSAIAAVVVRKIGNDERSAVLLLYPMVANFVLMGLRDALRLPADAGGASRRRRADRDPRLRAALCHIAAYRSGSAVVVAPMQYSQILGRWLYGFIFFDETPDWNTAIGAGDHHRERRLRGVPRGAPNVSKNRPVLATTSRYVAGTYPRISTLFRFLRKH